MSSSAPPTYWDYLALDRLLALQNGLDDDDTALLSDELHFIVVHQVFELWFKLVLRELRLARDRLGEPKVPEETVPWVVHHLRRVGTIFELAIDQFRVMETLTPQDFLAFRDKLVPASGFQSYQMREIELLLGLSDTQRHSEGGGDPLAPIRRLAAASPGGAKAWAAIERAQAEPSLRATLHAWLYRTPIDGSHPDDPGDDARVVAFLEAYLAAQHTLHARQSRDFAPKQGHETAHLTAQFGAAEEAARRFLFAEDVEDAAARPQVRRTRAGLLFIESYRELPLLAWPRLLIDTIVELEELMVLWRTRHARMVERTIGRRMGTGGSSGVDYLDATAKYRIFTELWAVRTLLLPREALPPLQHASAYGFAAAE